MTKRTRWTDEENEIANKKFLQSVALSEDTVKRDVLNLCDVYI